MIKKRYMVIALGIISVLIGILLVNKAILAQTGEYDPWLDFNEDGIIDVNDLHPLGRAYGSSGDPTKNVTVTNFPLDEEGNLKVSVGEKPPQICKDFVEITVLDWSGLENYGYGVDLDDYNINPLLPYIFAPIGELINVTDLWIVITESTYGGDDYTRFDITINDSVTITTENLYHVNAFEPEIRAIHIEDESIRQLIHEGVNTLEFSNPSMETYIYRVIAFIEYYCEA